MVAENRTCILRSLKKTMTTSMPSSLPVSTSRMDDSVESVESSSVCSTRMKKRPKEAIISDDESMDFMSRSVHMSSSYRGTLGN